MYNNDYTFIDSLVDKVKNEDTNALYELYDFYKPIISACVNRIHNVHKSIEKDDLFSEAVFVLKDLCLKYNKDKSYFSYFLDIYIQPYLIAKIKSKYLENVQIVTLSEYDSYEPCDNCSFFEEHTELREEIDNLPKNLKQIIDLIYFKQLTQSECAVILGVSQAAINKRLQKAKKILKENLLKRL